MSTINKRKSLLTNVPKNEKTTKNHIGMQLLVVLWICLKDTHKVKLLILFSTGKLQAKFK